MKYDRWDWYIQELLNSENWTVEAVVRRITEELVDEITDLRKRLDKLEEGAG